MDWQGIGESVGIFMGYELFQVGGTTVTAASVVTFLIIILVSLWVSRVLQRVMRKALARGGIKDPGSVSTATRLLHYAVLLVGLGVALQTVGISLTSVFAAGAVVAVGVGFALQNILQNFVSGVILLTERSIRESDVLEVDGEMVLVERLGARATVARTREEEQVIIPNSTLVQSTVKNFTMSDDVYRVRARVGVSYGSDMKKVEEVLLDAALSVDKRHELRAPLALLLEFGDSSVVWEVSIWARDPLDIRIRLSELNKAIWWGLKDAGITIAFPQLDVHFDQPLQKGPAE